MKNLLTAIALLISLNGFGQTKIDTSYTFINASVVDSSHSKDKNKFILGNRTNTIVTSTNNIGIYPRTIERTDTSYGAVEFFRNGKRVNSPAVQIATYSRDLQSAYSSLEWITSRKIFLPSGKQLNLNKYFLFISKDMEQ